jgi:hypothetical protein
VDVLHRIVLFLGKRADLLAPASWHELLAALSSKHPDLRKTRLRKIVNAHNRVFHVDDGKVTLYPLDGEFVREYFDLAVDVESFYQTADCGFLSEPGTVKVDNNTIVVNGIGCVGEPSIGDDSFCVHFQFGDNDVYKLQETVEGNCELGEKFSADLHLRNDCDRFIKL